MQVNSRLGEIRRKRGISAAELATLVGVRRQTIYAIEGGSYVPNTAVSLRLAQALASTVEELFSLPEAPAARPEDQAVDLITDAEAPQPGQPVRLCRVGERMVAVPSPPVPATLPLADGIFLKAARSRKAVVESLIEDNYSQKILIAGCDPAMSILARHVAREAGIDLVTAGCSSTKAIQWLKEKKVHIAGSHLQGHATGEPNLPVVKKWFPPGGYKVITFAHWEEGLVVSKGNPKSIRQIADLSRRNVVMINREKGAGSRFLLDRLLKEFGIAATTVRGYDDTARGHIPAAWHIYARRADCCIATRAAAQVFGLDFIPLTTERYDLILPEIALEMRGIQVLLDVLNRSAFQRELEAVGHYDMSQSGKSPV